MRMVVVVVRSSMIIRIIGSSSAWMFILMIIVIRVMMMMSWMWVFGRSTIRTIIMTVVVMKMTVMLMMMMNGWSTVARSSGRQGIVFIDIGRVSRCYGSARNDTMTCRCSCRIAVTGVRRGFALGNGPAKFIHLRHGDDEVMIVWYNQLI